MRALRLLCSIPWRADPRRSAAAIVLRPLSALAGPLTAVLLKRIVDALVDGDARGAVWTAAALGATASLLYLLELAAWRVAVALEDNILGHVQARLALAVSTVPTLAPFERPEVLDDVTLVRDRHRELSRVLFKFPESAALAVNAVVTVVLLASIDPRLALLTAFVVPAVLAGVRSERIIRQAEDDTAQPLRRATSLFALAADPDAAAEVRVFGTQHALRHRQDDIWRRATSIYTRAGLRWSAWWSAGWLSFGAGFAGAVALVTMRAVSGRATAGDVVLTVVVAGQLNEYLAGAVMSVASMLRTMRTAGRIIALEDLARDSTQTPADAAPVPPVLRSGIDVDGVSFRYEGADAFALRDVTLHLPADGVVALVGENGAGKTTLVKLLLRLHEPASGSVLVDGVDVRRFAYDDWRATCTAGFQDFARLEFLVRESVGAGDIARMDDDTVRAAMAAAGGPALEPGVQLGSRWPGGAEPSGGQWQKLALARAAMRREPLLRVYDEPTAALDAQAEHALFERITQRGTAAAGTVTVLVSHRFSTVRSADLIVVLEAGRVTECGTHDDLVRAGRTYAQLYAIQARAYR